MNCGDIIKNWTVKSFNGKVKSDFFSLVSLFFVFLLILSSVSASTQTYSKSGDAFSSATGAYATASHCTGDNCTWINGSEVILGVYNGFVGGSATWTFNVTQSLSQITSAEVRISWPGIYGKGLHSIGTSTTSTVKVGSSTVASPVTSTSISCGTGDQYAFACFNAVPAYSVPLSAISSSTNVTLSVPSNTLWDVGTVELVVNYSEPVACSSNSDCGANDWVSGTNSCSSNDVYQNYKTYTCSNPGTTASSCSSSTAFVMKTDCGETTYGSWGSNYCNASGNVEKSRDVYNKGCSSGSCLSSTTQEKQTVLTCSSGCTNGACNGVSAACYSNSDCGTDGWAPFLDKTCSNNDLYAKYRTYTCSNPGTAQASCSYSESPRFYQECGDTYSDPWETSCNVGTYIQTLQTTYHKGCVTEDGLSNCQFYTDNNVLPLIYCEKGCANGACNSSACWLDSQCGTSGWVNGATQCYLNNVYQNYTTASCTNPGYSNASCSNKTELKLKETCANGCSNGVCTSTASGIKIVNGKIQIDGTEFLIKGLDYAPWILKTGPDSTQGQLPFPSSRTEDVTSKVTNSQGAVFVKDYSGDGKIQAWEVIRFDVETMKKLGANTIRTYSTGSWHDKDLDGVVDTATNPDTSEIVQGDLPDWAVDELLTWAQANNMKVIIGYWVQEENFKESPRVADWDDLKVAEQAFGRVVNKYKTNSAVLGWGIGNEVNGVFNQGWFSWGVNVNDYLNALFAYTRTLDTAHPIIYAKYVGENANFNNLTADIIAENAFTHPADELNSLGEFNIPAPQGKAYMLGEFGHIIDQAEGHWSLAENYAGGAFLEYNNVWWKGDGHNLLGVVDEYRAVNQQRYSVLYNLFGGAPVCSTNAECGTDTTGVKTCDGLNVVLTSKVYTCNNPNTSAAFCSSADQTEIVQTCTSKCLSGSCTATCSSNSQCGTNGVIGKVCKGNYLYNMYRTFKCNSPGKVNSYCSYVDTNKYSANCTYGCLSATCLPKPACSKNASCGTSGYSANYCDGGNVVKKYTQNTCLNPNTQAAVCDRQETVSTVETCTNGCSAGKCLPAPCGFSDGIDVSAETSGYTAWDISQVQLTVVAKVGLANKTFTFTKNGNDIYSGEGAYSTASSCGESCAWLAENQVIVGAYNSDPAGWGGKVTWRFDLGTIDPASISKVSVKVLKPNVYGKGLHSPQKTGKGILKVENLTLATLTTSVAKCGTDWFAKSCSTTSMSYSKSITSTVCIKP